MTGRGTAEHRPTGRPRTDTQNQAMSGRGERRAGSPGVSASVGNVHATKARGSRPGGSVTHRCEAQRGAMDQGLGAKGPVWLRSARDRTQNGNHESPLREVEGGARGKDRTEETEEPPTRDKKNGRTESPRSPRRFSGRKEELRMSNATKSDCGR